jgi:hypothetical protein
MVFQMIHLSFDSMGFELWHQLSSSIQLDGHRPTELLFGLHILFFGPIHNAFYALKLSFTHASEAIRFDQYLILPITIVQWLSFLAENDLRGFTVTDVIHYFNFLFSICKFDANDDF